ncbi:fimbria/pilus outer membrane usher protein [Serratia sp. UGAL515B_01]|uniref:fimbria/pilus outer membrane usher protein n=1 Tax=Serratia sp. UGAL515B_01 TaxID=2986763 RepID=UPI002952A86C|nr:fimbria/pilus outer membrane usher protein [Serratia sp. UGAL515B_01]WON76640.1 fimbrial biogenesis outer membrane usher protein [Serratia sp. UGAL515B_01]
MTIKINTIQGYNRSEKAMIVNNSLHSIHLKPLVIWLGLSVSHAFAESTNEQFEFDPNMLIGETKTLNNLDHLNHPNSVEPGEYQVDIFINGQFFSNKPLRFAIGQQQRVSACLSQELLLEADVLPEAIRPLASTSQQSHCLSLEQWVDGASSNFDFSRLRLDLSVPQVSMQHQPRGAVPVSELSAGDMVAFTSYDTNYYRTKAFGSTTDSAFLGVNAGINLGLWQFRQQSSFTRYRQDSGSNNNRWDAIRTYMQRPLPTLGSQLTLGESFTPGSLFSSLGFRGIMLQTDERMRPESQQGYAPTIRGVAATTAKVSVRQSGILIYQTTVAPGAFVINDLYPTSFQGGLAVDIQEADGRVSSFTVPFSALPDSMRPGHSNYSFAAGKVRNVGNSDAKFADLTYQTGLTNAITANSGVRISDGYQALLAGAVVASELGALGFNATYSRADLWGETLKGWRLGSTYSRTITPTATTLTLASYHYSIEGYRDLTDVLGLRDTDENNAIWTSNSYQQSNQWVATVSQSLGEYGQLNFSGSTTAYRGGRERDTQYQMSYSNHFKGISYNLSVGRQKTGSTRYNNNVNDQVTSDGSVQNIVMLSLSIPLRNDSHSPTLSSSVTHTTGKYGTTSYQTSLTGTLGEAQRSSYALNGAFDPQGNGASIGGNITQQTSIATVGGNLSQGKHYTQGGASARGALVLHSGGVTLGPYIGDTFALIEAKNVHGANVVNGMGAQIDRFGYAIVPSLVPYRYNDIILDAKGIENPNTELAENQKHVAPYAGSVVKVSFKTVEGYPLLIKLRGPHTSKLLLGSNVYDSNDAIVGLIGQSAQLYARVPNKQGLLRLKWGEAASEQCTLNYDLDGQESHQSLYHLELSCN